MIGLSLCLIFWPEFGTSHLYNLRCQRLHLVRHNPPLQSLKERGRNPGLLERRENPPEEHVGLRGRAKISGWVASVSGWVASELIYGSNEHTIALT